MQVSLDFIQSCDNFRFLGYVFTFLYFENSEINNRFEYLSRVVIRDAYNRGQEG